VEHAGPAVAENMESQPFGLNGMDRPGASGSDPHLGMGLYIVRMIAQFHGGATRARNNADGTGVVITVEMPAVPPR